LTVSLTATGPSSVYTWSGGTGSFANASSLNTSYIPGVGDNGTITLYLTALGNCTSGGIVDSILVSITPAPTPIVSGSNGSAVCLGSTFTLSVNSQSATTYTWNPGNTNGTSVTVSPATQTIYSVDAANSCGISNATFTLNVNPLPVVFAVNDTVCNGNAATISSSGASTYSWSTGASGASINPAPAATTQYTVTGTDGNGCVNTAIAEVFVNQLPNVAVSSTTICPGTTATLTASGAATYSWITSQSGNSISVSPILSP